MTNGAVETAYFAVMSLLVLTFMDFCIVLAFLCKKKPLESEESLPTKSSARSYTQSEIDEAADGISTARVIGRGRFGSVYTGVMETGKLAAIKRIHTGLVLTNDAGFGFSAVIRSISLAPHPNIVPVIGFLQAPGKRIVVNDFVDLGSLEFYLHHNIQGNASLLDWSRRVRVAAGAARGLEYLHSHNIRHGFVKSSNVLIDFSFTARVPDYGLLFLAPLKEGDYSNEGEYSFGMVLLEILSGRRSDDRGSDLTKWALPLIKGREFPIPKDTEVLLRLGRVALSCVGNSRKNSPSMVEVAAILGNLELQT